MSIEVNPSQALAYQQWVQSVNDAYEAFRLLTDTQLRVGLLAVDAFQSVLRTAIDDNTAGKLLGQPLREAMAVAIQLAAYGPANDNSAFAHIPVSAR
ncbi:hypothetical protein [Burkholderia cenocepacia]|uniref:hypothetical protein n=1 Tax=Burkholderia cenocepacia TaxID=95486 RepID=UPI002AB26BE6|nr:hypothetical protein [Burkholderia cenocepacia]